MIVTIDGPAGSGKSTTARGVADRLGYVYLDTGAMYRAAALAFLRADAAPTDSDAASLLPQIDVDVTYEGTGEMHVFLNGEDVTGCIRAPEVGPVVSEISTLRAVRDRMVTEQRRIGYEQESKRGGVVLDGRDTGTVVFPDADVKVFMVADVEERARRRKKEYAADGRHVDLEVVQREIRERDERDRNREIAPLCRAEDAVTLDTTHRTIEEQVAFVVDRVKECQNSGT